MPKKSNTAKIGLPAPDFTLSATTGEKISLGNYQGEKNVVVVFLRGFF